MKYFVIVIILYGLIGCATPVKEVSMTIEDQAQVILKENESLAQQRREFDKEDPQYLALTNQIKANNDKLREIGFWKKIK